MPLLAVTLLPSINLTWRTVAQTLISITPECTDCVNTTATTKRSGYVPDTLGYNWLPLHHYNGETTSEFRVSLRSPLRKFGAFSFFLDRSGEHRIENEVALSKHVGLKSYKSGRTSRSLHFYVTASGVGKGSYKQGKDGLAMVALGVIRISNIAASRLWAGLLKERIC